MIFIIILLSTKGKNFKMYLSLSAVAVRNAIVCSEGTSGIYKISSNTDKRKSRTSKAGFCINNNHYG